MAKKKCTVLLLAALILILLPKGIDLLFDWYCKPLSLHHLKAQDILSYTGVVVGFGGVLATIYLSVKQFRLQNRPFIIPQNQRFFYYASEKFQPPFLSTMPNLTAENRFLYSPGGPNGNSMHIKLKNIGNGTAATFSVEIAYNVGKEFKELVAQLGHENCGFTSTFKPDLFRNAGMFNAEEVKNLPLTFNLAAMISKICEAQYINERSKDTAISMKNNVFIGKQHKLASIFIKATDILDIHQEEHYFSYDICLEVCDAVSLVSENGLYSEVFLTFKCSGEK